MSASTNDNKIPTSTAAVNAADSNTPTVSKVRREVGATTLMSNGTSKLSSLTPARDLTLGGKRGDAAGATKKVFVPNLNAARNKNSNVKTSKDTTVRGRGRGRGAERGGRGGTRGGRGGSSSLIQTTGVFSEGAGALHIRQSSRSSDCSRDADAAPSAMRRPTLLKSHNKLDIKAALARDAEILKALDDSDDDEEEQNTDLDNIPVQLREGKKKYVKSETKLKSPTKSESETNDTKDPAKTASNIPMNGAELDEDTPQTLEQLLNSSQSRLFIMQVPDTLPCVEDDSAEEAEKPSTSASADDTTQSNPPEHKPAKTSVLKKINEGQVGRLIRYKSGKIKLMLGENAFDLHTQIGTGFLQNLMSIHANSEKCNGEMINLGPIQTEITVTPDWEQLLKHAERL